MRAPANPPATPLGRLALVFIALMAATALSGPCAMADEPGSSASGRAAILARHLSGGVPQVSADVPLAELVSAESVVGSFTASGLTFAITGEGEVALMAVSASTLASGMSGPSQQAIPASVEHDGVAYAVTAIGPRALAGCDADAVIVPATVELVDESAFQGSSVASIEVAAGNPHYSSYDGMLFDAEQIRLLLIPEGKQGAARIPKTAEVVDPSSFSHSAGVSAIDVEAGSAAFSSRNGCLYDASGETLIWDPGVPTDEQLQPPGVEEGGCSRASDGFA